MQKVQLQLTKDGLDKLKLAGDRFRQGAALLEEAHELLIALRDSGELLIVGNVLGIGEGDAHPLLTPAIVP